MREKHPRTKNSPAAHPPRRSAKTLFAEHFAFRFAGQLVVYRLRARDHKTFNRLRCLRESARAKTPPSPALPLAAWSAVKPKMFHRLASYHTVEPGELLLRLLFDRRTNRSGNPVDLLIEPLRQKERFGKISQRRKIQLLEGVVFEHAFQETVGAAPGSLDAQVLTLLLRAGHRELAKRMVQVPRHELELVGLRMQIKIKILAHHQNAIQCREPHRDRHEPREFLQVHKLADPAGKVGIR